MKLEELKESMDASSMGDFIVSKFKAGKITHEEAKKKLLSHNLDKWVSELDKAASKK